MEVKERVIDLRQYFLYLWENAIVIVLVVALFTFGMMGLSYKKQKKEISTLTEAEVASLDAIMTQNHDAYYRLNDVTAYTDANPPADTYNSSARLYVDFNYSNVEGNENLDLSSLTIKYQQDSLLLLISNESLDEVIKKLNLKDDKDMTNITASDLSWMVNRNYMGANIMQVVVSDVNPDRAQNIANAVIEEFQNRIKDYEAIDKVEIIDEPSLPQIGIKTDDSESSIKRSISKKKLLKYGIVGCMGGAVFIAVICFIIFVFKDAVRNSLDLSFAKLSLFGFTAYDKKKEKQSYGRVANNIALIDDCNVLTIVPVDSRSESNFQISELETDLKGFGKSVCVISNEEQSAGDIAKAIEKNKKNNDIVLVAMKNIKECADSTIAAVNSDAVLLIATYSKTRMKDIVFAKEEMDRTGVKNFGVIMTQVKHI